MKVFWDFYFCWWILNFRFLFYTADFCFTMLDLECGFLFSPDGFIFFLWHSRFLFSLGEFAISIFIFTARSLFSSMDSHFRFLVFQDGNLKVIALLFLITIQSITSLFPSITSFPSIPPGISFVSTLNTKSFQSVPQCNRLEINSNSLLELSFS